MNEINEMSHLKGAELNEAKKLLAFEVTKQIHGEAEAVKARDAAQALFASGTDTDNMPSTDITQADFTDGYISLPDLLVKSGIAPSKGEGRRLIKQGGIAVDGEKATDPAGTVSLNDFGKKYIIIRKGKKIYHKINLK